MADVYAMDIYEVMKQLPHRYPFLLVDKVLESTFFRDIFRSDPLCRA